MGLKDDFLEALNSVKKDIFNGSEDTEPNADETAQSAARSDDVADNFSVESASDSYSGYMPQSEDEIAPPLMDNETVFDAFKQASVIDGESFGGTSSILDDGGDEFSGEAYNSAYTPPPFVSYDPETAAGESNIIANPPAVSAYGSKMYDFDRTDLYSDDKTIISKNTVIQGNLQTNDSVRLLGQVNGDIDCKSNIIVAGKVRGNTSAANAYIMDAQIDGSLHCDDVVSVSSDAWVLGDIRAQQAEIDGKIKGNLDIRHAISIGSTSSIIGNISTDELEIKRGAFVNGQVMMYTPSRDILDRFEDFDK